MYYLQPLKKMKNKYIKIVTSLIISMVLILVWVVASLFFNNKISFSVLMYTHNKSDIVSSPKEKLLKGDKIIGQFQAREDNLGIVILGFKSYVKYDFSGEDVFYFRIKEKGEREWVYVNSYRSGTLQHQLEYPFGFPIFEKSKDKTYEFEIESIYGNKKNAIELNTNNPSLITGYQFPKSEILSSKKSTLNFLIKKSITSFTNLDFLLSSILYLTPLIIYIFIYSMYPWWKKNKYLGFIPCALLLFLIPVDLFLIKEVYIGALLALILGWIYLIIRNKLESKINFIFAFILILLWVLLIKFNIDKFQNKINIWTYTFLIIGVVQAVLEEKRFIKNK